jgi:hypothetical protein
MKPAIPAPSLPLQVLFAVLLAFICVTPFGPSSVAAQSKRPMTFMDSQETRNASAPAISP